MRECDPSLSNVEELQAPIIKKYPSNLWYLIESEVDIIAMESIPSSGSLLSSCLQQRVCERLGKCSVYLLSVFIQVNRIIYEEVKSCIENSGNTSQLGKVQLWTHGLQSKMVSASNGLFEAVAKAVIKHVLNMFIMSVGVSVVLSRIFDVLGQ